MKSLYISQLSLYQYIKCHYAEMKSFLKKNSIEKLNGVFFSRAEAVFVLAQRRRERRAYAKNIFGLRIQRIQRISLWLKEKKREKEKRLKAQREKKLCVASASLREKKNISQCEKKKTVSAQEKRLFRTASLLVKLFLHSARSTPHLCARCLPVQKNIATTLPIVYFICVYSPKSPPPAPSEDRARAQQFLKTLNIPPPDS